MDTQIKFSWTYNEEIVQKLFILNLVLIPNLKT